MSELTEKEKIGEELITKLAIGFMNQILSFEAISEGEFFFDNLDLDADLKDGRTLKISLTEQKESDE